MSIAHPWLQQEPWPTKQMPKKLLESRIERVLCMTNIGYLGTVRKDGSPIVSPVEFYSEGFTLYMFPQPNSPKHKAVKRDPRVAFAIANPMAGWACVMGAQFFGTGTLLDTTTVLCVSEFGGPNANSTAAQHSPDNLPYLLIGGSGTPFRTGQYLSVDATHGDYLLTLARGFGSTESSMGVGRDILDGILKG